MKDESICYSIGALLYSPANNESIVHSLVHEKFSSPFSLALCLEDTIADNFVEEAEAKLVDTLHKLALAASTTSFFMPKIFIRVRNPGQIDRLYKRLHTASSLLTGFIIPKFSPENADTYISRISLVNSQSQHPVYMMPIMESPSIINLKNRYDILYSLKKKLDAISPFVLNIRVGGNDLCHAFGFRRHSDESIYQIRPVASIFSDIISVFGMDYVVSGPVWEYYNGDNWENGLIQELSQDRLNGFIGKTVIHPHQIALVNRAYMVSQKDYQDALSILNWDQTSHSLVSGSASKERMNECKTHSNWAKKIIMLSQVYGISDES